MNSMKKLFMGLALASCHMASLAGIGYPGAPNFATVTTTLQDSANYGGCMVRLDPGPATYTSSDGGNLNCPGDTFVTFDCLNTSGQVVKSTANALYQTALLAHISNKKVDVIVDDSVKINGFCLARRIDLVGQ